MITLLPDDVLDVIHAQLEQLTAHQLRFSALPEVVNHHRCSATYEHVLSHLGKPCNYAARYVVGGKPLCWTHAKIAAREVVA